MPRGNLVRAVPAPRELPRRVWVSPRRYAVAALVVWLGLPVAGCYWPRSSSVPVPQLAHPAFDAATSGLQPPFRFAVFGDQKGLAKSGEWDALLRDLRSLDPPPAFLLDTGDIVENGVHRDQFVRLEQILSVVSDLPYLLAVGNHEDHARCLWNGAYAAHGDRTLPEILIDSGVDLVLTGHTHTYEVIRASRGGRAMLSVNVSGRSGGSRRARPVSNPMRAFASRGWDMSGWESVSQGVVMPSGALVNQFGLVTVTADGELECVIHHVDDPRPRPCHQ